MNKSEFIASVIARIQRAARTSSLGDTASLTAAVEADLDSISKKPAAKKPAAK